MAPGPREAGPDSCVEFAAARGRDGVEARVEGSPGVHASGRAHVARRHSRTPRHPMLEDHVGARPRSGCIHCGERLVRRGDGRPHGHPARPAGRSAGGHRIRRYGTRACARGAARDRVSLPHERKPGSWNAGGRVYRVERSGDHSQPQAARYRRPDRGRRPLSRTGTVRITASKPAGRRRVHRAVRPGVAPCVSPFAVRGLGAGSGRRGVWHVHDRGPGMRSARCAAGRGRVSRDHRKDRRGHPVRPERTQRSEERARNASARPDPRLRTGPSRARSGARPIQCREDHGERSGRLQIAGDL